MIHSLKKRVGEPSGFTLIELMIVISIISILATMAVPSFQDRVIRAQVEEAFALSSFVRAEIEAHYTKTGRFPKNNKAAGLPTPEKIIGNYVNRVAVENGMVLIRLGNRINKHAEGKVIALRPAIVKNEPKVPIAWVYGYASIPEGMITMTDNKTSIMSRFLPVNARY